MAFTMNNIKVRTILLLCGVAPVTALGQNVNPSQFDFSFSAQPNAQRSERNHIVCNFGGLPDLNCNEITPDGFRNTQWFTGGNLADDFISPILQETVDINGETYYHVVIGEEQTGFAQEIYMKTASTRFGIGAQRSLSDSGGMVCLSFGGSFEQRMACSTDTNGADPLRQDGVFTGNGVGNPSRMAMRQVVTDFAGFDQEFFKGQTTQKPIITQNMDGGQVSSHFVMDMSNSDYLTDTTPGDMTNTLSINDPNVPTGSGNFDFATDQGADANVTGGRFTFRRTTAPHTNAFGGITVLPSSEYVYFDGTIDPVLDVNWEVFRDPAQNQ